ncbi:MAG TPA: magnesium transporter [Firmicutes bacterium]|nr:magnesium transporter [Bacillota bacterium]
MAVYKTIADKLVKLDNIDDTGLWINLVCPTEHEIQETVAQTGLLPEFLRAALDEEEVSRIEAEDNQLLIIINVPIVKANDSYDTIPLGIVINEHYVVTICLENNDVTDDFIREQVRNFYTFKKTRFLFQIFFRTATLFLKYLRLIDRKTNDIELELHRSMKNKELFKLLSLEKSLVYFTTSLHGNEKVMEKILRLRGKANTETQLIKMYPDDEELLEDVIVENKQAIEMAHIHSDILSGTMDAFASIISNNLNIVMKFLASITIVLSLPTMISSFFGMNVPLPSFAGEANGFFIVLALTVISSIGAVILLLRKNMF